MFGERLKELREDKQMPQRLLAKKLGVTQQAVGKWETGKAEPDMATIDKLADIFGVSADYLLGRTNTPDPINNRNVKIIAAQKPEGWDELTPEAQEAVDEFIQFMRHKHRKD